MTLRDNWRAQCQTSGGTEPNAAIQGQDAAPKSQPARPPELHGRPPVCLHSPVQHEINIERSIAGRVSVAAVAHARVEEEEENDY